MRRIMLRTIPRMCQWAILAIALTGLPSQADQNNPELDQLFDLLHQSNDPVEAAAITGKIWENWYQNDDENIDKLMQLGEISMRQGKLDHAIELYTKVIELDSEFAEGWNRRATAYYLMGEYQLSTEDVTETLKREPRHFGALSGQGMIYTQLQQTELALEYYQKALEMNPHMLGVENSIKIIKQLLQEETI